jgi:ribosome-binding protein aMBF1 (putative translation factor)
MDSSIARNAAARQRELPEKARAMATAALRKAENVDFREQIGRAIFRTRMLSGLSLKEFAAAVDRDERQVARWEKGEENPQLHLIFADPTLRRPLIIALAELVEDGVEVTTHITIRKTA